MRQILILEKEDRERLKQGETISVMFGGQECGLASDETPKRTKAKAPDTMEVISDNGKRPWNRKSGETTITEQTFRYLKAHGPLSSRDVAVGLGAAKSAVQSALLRARGLRVARKGKGFKTLWRAI